MAENESLDISYRKSRRWRALHDQIRNGATDDVIATAILENLYQTFKGVVRQIPLKALLEAMQAGGDVRGIIRDCQDHEYAQLVAAQYQVGLAPVDIVEHSLWATVDRFLEQIALDVVGSSNWADFQTYDQAATTWRRDVFDGVRELARKLAANPEQPPRLPSRTAEQKILVLARLNSMSLLRGTGDSHDQV